MTSMTRANGEGDLCPSWCVTDHAQYGFHGGEGITVYAPQFHSCRVRALRYSYPGAPPAVEVAASGIFSVSPGDAGKLADLIEQLATATPEEHRALAAAIRRAAETITQPAADSPAGGTS